MNELQIHILECIDIQKTKRRRTRTSKGAEYDHTLGKLTTSIIEKGNTGTETNGTVVANANVDPETEESVIVMMSNLALSECGAIDNVAAIVINEGVVEPVMIL